MIFARHLTESEIWRLERELVAQRTARAKEIGPWVRWVANLVFAWRKM